MKHIVIIFILFILFWSCRNNNSDTKELISAEQYSHKVASCKIYSADFVLIDPNDKGLLIQEFIFNKKGFVNELIRYNLDGEITGKFDIFGEHTPFPMPEKPIYIDTLITVFEIDSTGNIKNKEMKSYNELGLLIEYAIYSNEDELVKKNTYSYNNQGFITEDIYWDIDLMKPKQKIRYEYEYFKDL